MEQKEKLTYTPAPNREQTDITITHTQPQGYQSTHPTGEFLQGHEGENKQEDVVGHTIMQVYRVLGEHKGYVAYLESWKPGDIFLSFEDWKTHKNR